MMYWAAGRTDGGWRPVMGLFLPIDDRGAREAMLALRRLQPLVWLANESLGDR